MVRLLQGWQPTLNGQDNRAGKLAIFNVIYGSHIFTFTYTFSGLSVRTSDPEHQTAANTRIRSLSGSCQFQPHTSQKRMTVTPGHSPMSPRTSPWTCGEVLLCPQAWVGGLPLGQEALPKCQQTRQILHICPPESRGCL